MGEAADKIGIRVVRAQQWKQGIASSETTYMASLIADFGSRHSLESHVPGDCFIDLSTKF